MGRFALTMIVAPYWLLPNAGGTVPMRALLVAFTSVGERRRSIVNGSMSYCHSLDEFHCCRYHAGFAVVPAFAIIYLIVLPLGPITDVPPGTFVTLNNGFPVYASKA